ncbi:hypothetical protein BBJ28_00000980 [Nothophytophthora sp. Chile5]|nr:hypothetical protein BBJ28_00000980 [Nothophytophthora sp. Chile5]
MRTDADAAKKAARAKKKRRSAEHSRRSVGAGDGASAEGKWKAYTSPDGHPYYYNEVGWLSGTKESRWELPQTPSRRSRGSRRKVVQEEAGVSPVGGGSVAVGEEPPRESSAPDEAIVSASSEVAASSDRHAKGASKPKNAMFQRLQASLEGRLNTISSPMMMMGRPPPMLHIQREEKSAFSGGGDGTEHKAEATPTLEEQYEAETAHMNAAERLRFLRRKRQETMLSKQKIVEKDDFMAEFASNMKKKEAMPKSQRKSDASNTSKQWKDQEAAEEERKRQQLAADVEAKEQEEARKEREQQAAAERERLLEQEREEQQALEQQRELERKRRQQERNERRIAEAAANEEAQEERSSSLDGQDQEEEGSVKSSVEDQYATDEAATTATELVAESKLETEASTSGRVEGKGRRQRSKHDHALPFTPDAEHASSVAGDSHRTASEERHAGHHTPQSKSHGEKKRAHEERHARRLHEEELAEAQLTEQSQSPAVSGASQKSIGSADALEGEHSPLSAESEEDQQAKEKQLRRERRRMAKLETALAAQQLEDTNGSGGKPRARSGERNESHGEEQHTDTHASGHEGSGGSVPPEGFPNGYAASGYPMNGYAPPGYPFGNGMYPPYPPYMMMPPPPPPSPYGFAYPYGIPPPMMPVPGYPGMPPGYQAMPQPPQPPFGGMVPPSAMVPRMDGDSISKQHANGDDYNSKNSAEMLLRRVRAGQKASPTAFLMRPEAVEGDCKLNSISLGQWAGTRSHPDPPLADPDDPPAGH